MSKKNTERTNSVPVLITWDVDPTLWMPFDKKQWGLNTAMNMCHRQGIRATFFITAEPAHLHLQELENMRAQGHEIGCHGLTHGNEENYDRMPEEMQRAYIEEATEIMQDLIKAHIHAFRSPRVKTSAYALRLLAELGYLSDSSVCSQRMDLVSSNLFNAGWLFAPRRPYHPRHDNAFKRGDIPLWEIPISAAIIPFISAAMHVLGLSAMKILFRLLYAESRRTGKPIVYLSHPAEFIKVATKGRKRASKTVKREHLTPSYIRAHGLRIRNLMDRVDAETMIKYTQELFAYMASFANVEFMTISEYTISHL